MKLALLALGVVAGILLACGAPTEPSAEQARYYALLKSPAWSVDSTREAEFGFGETFGSGGIAFLRRVLRDSVRWSAQWDTITTGGPPSHLPLPAVDFTTEMVLYVSGYTYSVPEIIHVTRQRDTTFVLVRFTEGCNTGLESIEGLAFVKLVPQAPPPTYFLNENWTRNCKTGTIKPDW